jgi:hypothetical protein
LALAVDRHAGEAAADRDLREQAALPDPDRAVHDDQPRFRCGGGVAQREVLHRGRELGVPAEQRRLRHVQDGRAMRGAGGVVVEHRPRLARALQPQGGVPPSQAGHEVRESERPRVLGDVAPLERHRAEHARGVQVRGWGRCAPGRELGRHEAGRADGCSRGQPAGEGAREVDEPQPPTAAACLHEDVGGLQVTVHDPSVVKEPEGVEKLSCELRDAFRGDRSHARERGALDPVLDQMPAPGPFVPPEIVNRGDADGGAW